MCLVLLGLESYSEKIERRLFMTSYSPALFGVLTANGPRSLVPFLTALKEEYARQGKQDKQEMVCLSVYAEKPEDMEEALVRGAQRLVELGVECIALPSGATHAYLPEIQAATSVPVINMIEETVQSLPDASLRVALLTTRETMESGVYQEVIEASGHICLTDPAWQAAVDTLIEHTDQPAYRERLSHEWQDLVRALHASDAQVAIIAASELSVLQKPASELTIIDAEQCLAQAVVKRYA